MFKDPFVTFWCAVGVIITTTVICSTYYSVEEMRETKQVEIEAIRAGLVQERASDYSTTLKWVNPKK